MKKGQLIKGTVTPYVPLVTEAGHTADIDSSFTVRQYTGDRIAIPVKTHPYGIKTWSQMPASMQGMAIYGNILVRMANVSTSTTHYIYEILSTGGLQLRATFTCSTSGHSNSIQFAPRVEAGNDYPYFYVDYLSGICTVFSMDSSFNVTQVQTITATGASFLHIGDDGHIWAARNSSATGYCWAFTKYRKVSVSEGANVTLTDADIVQPELVSEAYYPYSEYTHQGWKIKYGKFWFPMGGGGSDEKRAICVIDMATGRLLADIDLSNYAAIEFEDLDFWEDNLILCTYKATNYLLRF